MALATFNLGTPDGNAAENTSHMELVQYSDSCQIKLPTPAAGRFQTASGFRIDIIEISRYLHIT